MLASARDVPAGRWVRLTREDALAHPLYGLRGWLLVLLILLLLHFLQTAWLVLPALPSLVEALPLLFDRAPVLAVMLVESLVQMLAAAWLRLLGFALRPSFRAWALWLLPIAGLARLALIIQFSVVEGELNPTGLLLSFLGVAVAGVAFCYTLLSGRVRVTYLWQAAVDDSTRQGDQQRAEGPAVG